MSVCCANFLAPEKGPGGRRQFRICTTAVPASGGAPLGQFPRQVFDGPVAWELAIGSRNDLAAQTAAALAADGGYPQEAASAMLAQLGWVNGYPLSAAVPAPSTQFTFSYDSCWLLPELVPVETPDGTITWRDTLGPIHRTLDQIEVAVPRPEEKRSLAIVHAENDGRFAFDRAAAELQESLLAALRVVDTYREADFLGTPEKRFRCLKEVFFRHNAVMFLGHLEPAGPASEGGWRLSSRLVLTMGELGRFLKAHRGFPDPGRKLTAGWAVPEVIFANCCFSAGRDPDSGDQPGLSYPKLFLDLGVRFFIGTWMNVVFSQRDPQAGLALVIRLAREFFLRWADDPDRAVEHLYEAKRACAFHLLTALYQIYAAGGWQATQPESRQPLGPLITGVAVGDRLGEYGLERELWADPASRTFAAHHLRDGTFHLVQVLADQLQDHPDLPARLTGAIGKLQEAVNQSENHLVPDRHEQVMLTRDGVELRRLHVLVYDRPAGETADVWLPLQPAELDRDAPDSFGYVLRLGASISQALAELHAKELLHGNFDCGSIVLRRQDDHDHAVIKDAWMRQAGLGRSTKARYAAPEELAHGTGTTDQLKYDCWGLGIVLYELAAGQPPFDDQHPPERGLRRTLAEALGGAATRVPTALDRVVRECLVPAAQLRPTADFVARRLLLAVAEGGDYIGELESDLNTHIQAGHRLFAVLAGDVDEMEAMLCAMASHPHRNLSPLGPPATHVRYRLYVAAEGVGLVERVVGGQRPTQQFVRVSWVERPTVPPDAVAAANAVEILRYVSGLQSTPDGQIPVLLLRGCRWWYTGFEVTRLLKAFQADPLHSSVVIVCDDFIVLEEHLDRSCVKLRYPPPAPAVLFERILGFQGPGPAFPAVSAEMAFHLAEHFFPCGLREVEQALRLCALEHGVIDGRALLLRDQQLQRLFQAQGMATYLPLAKLPRPEFIGLPQHVVAELQRWADQLAASPSTERLATVPRRLLISGPAECGKSTLARSLGAWIGRNVVQIDPNTCLRRGLGDSETALRTMLGSVSSMHGGMVLLDDVDRFFQSAGLEQSAAGAALRGGAPPPDRPPLQAALTRMASILLHWLDWVPPSLIVVSVARDAGKLSPEWRRRMDLHIELEEPMADLEYRCQVFAALLRKHRLEGLAQDPDLVRSLARQTHPVWRGQPLPSPLSRMDPERFGAGEARLSSGAAIEAWMKETISLFHSAARPADSRQFWLDAIQ